MSTTLPVTVTLPTDGADENVWGPELNAAIGVLLAALNGLAKSTIGLGNVPNVDACDRATHTGLQLSATISDFAEAARDAVGASMVAGPGITVTVDDNANTITIGVNQAGGNSSGDTVYAQGTGVVETASDGQQYRLVAPPGGGPATFVLVGAPIGGGGGNGGTTGIVATQTVQDTDYTLTAGDLVPVYTGSWQDANNAGDSDGHDRFINSAGDVLLSWTAGVDGNGLASFIQIFGPKAPWHGVANFSVDGAAPTPIDCSASVRSDNVLLFTTPSFSTGKHTVRMSWTGTNGKTNQGATIGIDRWVATNAIGRTSGGGGGTVVPTGFVQRNGKYLKLGTDTTWQFVGFNSFCFENTCGTSGEQYNDAQTDAAFAAIARTDGRTAVRFWAFPNMGTAAVLKVIAIAAKYNVKVIPTLADAAGGCGDSSGASSFASWIGGGWQGTTKTWINTLIPLIANNTAVMAIDLCNEPPNDANIVAGFQAMAGLVASLDGNHLVTIGSQPPWNYGSGDSGGYSRYKAIFSGIETATGGRALMTMHEYDGAPSCGFGGPFAAPSAHYYGDDNVHGAQQAAHDLLIPLCIEEWGIDPDGGGNSAGRVDGISKKLTAYLTGTNSTSGLSNDGTCGALYWSLKNGSPSCLDITTSSSEATTIKGFAIPA